MNNLHLSALIGATFLAYAPAQSITTTYAGGNSGSGTWTVQFDITNLTQVPMLITAFDVNCENTRSGGVGSPFTLDIWLTQLGGTYLGNETNVAMWTKVSTGTSVSRAMTTPTPVDVADFVLLPGRYGVALEYNGTAMSYTNGTGANQMYSNSDIQLNLGSSTTGRFGIPIYTPRVWNGSVYYFVGNAMTRPYGSGCNGSAGVPSLAPATGSLPKLGGTYTQALSGLVTSPPPITSLLLGASKSTWGGLTLPFDLGVINAAGCFVHASGEVALGGVGIGGVASYSLPIPSSTVFVGATAFFNTSSVGYGLVTQFSY